MASTGQRGHAHFLMHWLIGEQARIHYRQHRPMTTRALDERQLIETFERGGTITCDCSEIVTLVCRLAGLRDPNGLDYNGAGNSSTMFLNLPHYTDPAAAEVGAIVVFGPNGADHAAIVLEPGHDPLLFSHGQEAGPLGVRYSIEKRAHRTPATFLQVSEL